MLGDNLINNNYLVEFRQETRSLHTAITLPSQHAPPEANRPSLGPTGESPSASNQDPINSRAGRGEVVLLTGLGVVASHRTHRSTTHLFFLSLSPLANRRPSTLPTQPSQEQNK